MLSDMTLTCLSLCDPMGCSLPGSSVHRILQAKILEWDAISSIETWKILALAKICQFGLASQN